MFSLEHVTLEMLVHDGKARPLAFRGEDLADKSLRERLRHIRCPPARRLNLSAIDGGGKPRVLFARLSSPAGMRPFAVRMVNLAEKCGLWHYNLLTISLY